MEFIFNLMDANPPPTPSTPLPTPRRTAQDADNYLNHLFSMEDQWQPDTINERPKRPSASTDVSNELLDAQQEADAPIIDLKGHIGHRTIGPTVTSPLIIFGPSSQIMDSPDYSTLTPQAQIMLQEAVTQRSIRLFQQFSETTR